MTDERLATKIARTLCGMDRASGFCQCVGQELGCKVGNGEQFDGANCIATEEQLSLSGYMATADRVLDLLAENSMAGIVVLPHDVVARARTS
jgi:hypothetical protein